MIPYLKYYLRTNPYFNKEMPEIIPPSCEEWVQLRGYEPTKINPNYDEFVKTYIERKLFQYKRSTECKYEIGKVCVIDENITSEVEKQEEFVRWI